MIPKFRAWNKEKKEMQPVRTIDFDERTINDYPHNGVSKKASFDDIELLQLTGACDDYGQEIYEGDILLDEDEEDYGVVYRDRAEWRIKWYFTDCDSRLDEDFFISVSGNIYENPELLGGTNDE